VASATKDGVKPDGEAPPNQPMAQAAQRPRLPSVFNGATTWTKERLSEALATAMLLNPADELNPIRELGRGTFGIVHSASWTTTHPAAASSGGTMQVAVKTLVSRPSDEKSLREFSMEVKLLAEMSHPNIITVYGIMVGQDAYLSLVMEYMSGGSVFQILKAARQGRATRPQGVQMLRLLRDLARGMAHVHSRGVLHRDLKSLNLLLDATGTTLKVCDFGLSRRALMTAAMTRVGTVMWASPEILGGLAYSSLTDVWSFGVVLWEMATGCIPYEGMSSGEVVRNVVLHGLRLKPPGAHPIHCPLELIKLMAASFSPVERRPTFHHIVHTLESIIDSVQADIEAGHAAADALAKPADAPGVTHTSGSTPPADTGGGSASMSFGAVFDE